MKKRIVTILFTSLLLVSNLLMPIAEAEVYNVNPALEESNCQIEKEPSSTTSTQNETSSEGASESDWTKEGTVAYKHAKQTFDTFVSVGLSGEAAAGIIGWVNSEGGWYIIDRAEGHYGNDPASVSISKGVTPVPSGGGYSVGGGGVYQFTPYTKFAPIGDSKWESMEEQTKFVLNSIKSGDWVASMDMSGKNQSFEQFAKNTNIEETALGWQAYERGNTALIPRDQKIADAKTANEVFNKDKVKFDKEKFDTFFGGSGTSDSNSDSSKESSKSSDNSQDEDCIDESDSSTSNGGDGEWSKDKTGSVNYRQFTAWKANELPDDLKPYALNPESVGMKMNDTSTWQVKAYSYGQCTDLSASLMYALWEKDGEHPRMASGNGAQVAGNWASTFGGSTSSEPSAGAVFSGGGSPPNGHTGVVSHVFENGDILIVEQNYLGYSGDFSNLPVTWNYRYVPKAQFSSEGWSFYNPAKEGYKISSSAKSH